MSSEPQNREGIPNDSGLPSPGLSEERSSWPDGSSSDLSLDIYTGSSLNVGAETGNTLPSSTVIALSLDLGEDPFRDSPRHQLPDPLIEHVTHSDPTAGQVPYNEIPVHESAEPEFDPLSDSSSESLQNPLRDSSGRIVVDLRNDPASTTAITGLRERKLYDLAKVKLQSCLKKASSDDTNKRYRVNFASVNRVKFYDPSPYITSTKSCLGEALVKMKVTCGGEEVKLWRPWREYAAEEYTAVDHPAEGIWSDDVDFENWPGLSVTMRNFEEIPRNLADGGFPTKSRLTLSDEDIRMLSFNELSLHMNDQPALLEQGFHRMPYNVFRYSSPSQSFSGLQSSIGLDAAIALSEQGVTRMSFNSVSTGDIPYIDSDEPVEWTSGNLDDDTRPPTLLDLNEDSLSTSNPIPKWHQWFLDGTSNRSQSRTDPSVLRISSQTKAMPESLNPSTQLSLQTDGNNTPEMWTRTFSKCEAATGHLSELADDSCTHVSTQTTRRDGKVRRLFSSIGKRVRRLGRRLLPCISSQTTD